MLGSAFRNACTNETDNLMPRSPLRTRDASSSPRHGGLSMQASAWQKATTHGQLVHRPVPGVPSAALALRDRHNQCPVLRCAQEMLGQTEHGGHSPLTQISDRRCRHGMGASNHAGAAAAWPVHPDFEGSKCHVPPHRCWPWHAQAWGSVPTQRLHSPTSRPRGGGIEPCPADRGLPMRRHSEGSKCRVLCMGGALVPQAWGSVPIPWLKFRQSSTGVVRRRWGIAVARPPESLIAGSPMMAHQCTYRSQPTCIGVGGNMPGVGWGSLWRLAPPP